MADVRQWQSLVSSSDSSFLVSGTEIAQTIVGPHSRFAVIEVRCRAADGFADVRYRVRDAFTVSDAELKAGGRPKIVFECPTLDEAVAWCECSTVEALKARITVVVMAHPFGEPKAHKRGRRPEWPYVPVIHHVTDKRAAVNGRTEQIRAKAFKTPEEAVQYAAGVIQARRRDMAQKLLDPRYRAFREQQNLPAEVPAA